MNKWWHTLTEISRPFSPCTSTAWSGSHLTSEERRASHGRKTRELAFGGLEHIAQHTGVSQIWFLLCIVYMWPSFKTNPEVLHHHPTKQDFYFSWYLNWCPEALFLPPSTSLYWTPSKSNLFFVQGTTTNSYPGGLRNMPVLTGTWQLSTSATVGITRIAVRGQPEVSPSPEVLICA